MEDSQYLELFVGTKIYPTIKDAPVGILYLTDSIIFKTEYFNKDNHPECYIIESGEFYCGKYDVECKSLIIK